MRLTTHRFDAQYFASCRRHRHRLRGAQSLIELDQEYVATHLLHRRLSSDAQKWDRFRAFQRGRTVSIGRADQDVRRTNHLPKNDDEGISSLKHEGVSNLSIPKVVLMVLTWWHFSAPEG